jgi:sulfopyruvate decarboxylase TPP-binding subunit
LQFRSDHQEFIKTQIPYRLLEKVMSILAGADVMIFKIFSPKQSAKKLAFLTKNKTKLFKNLVILLVSENFSPKIAGNRRKL